MHSYKQDSMQYTKKMSDRPEGAPPTPEEVKAVLDQVQDKLQLVLGDYVGVDATPDVLCRVKSDINDTIQPIVGSFGVDFMKFIHVATKYSEETGNTLVIEIKDPDA